MKQIPGHLYGPPMPHIGFWYGAEYLGEVPAHPSQINSAQQKLHRQIELIEPGPSGRIKIRKLAVSRVVMYFGKDAVIPLFRTRAASN